eukprot:NODE_754_length_626_cov_256.661323_g745_i0.p2 GENE.NODE_754_length_626_cov_256.661323_g745_i0~~NODE_754_length_626_cov_256.661323_g745_i0.p2  ORF type:complete len:57 (-),score=14.80 NODE_754_length_626_cov_256.661323_g745_i0:383-553(-)
MFRSDMGRLSPCTRNLPEFKAPFRTTWFFFFLQQKQIKEAPKSVTVKNVNKKCTTK